jgi:tetratricopeptide (TPR) repeat protein
MKPQNLFRLFSVALVAALVSMLAPALSAQTAGTFASSGVTKLRLGDNDGAIADFSRALELNSSLIGAYLGRGAAYCNMSNFDGAVNDYNEAIKLKPASVEAYMGRGFAEFLQGNYDAAITDQTKAIELKSDSQAAYYQRALARGAQTNLQGASDDFVKALDLKGSDTATDYVALYGALYDTRMGHVAAEKLNAHTTWGSDWTKELGGFLSATVTEAELLKFAASKGGEDKSLQEGEALYFAGVAKAVAGDKAAAKADFQKSLSVSGGSTIVHRLAQTELDRG